MTVAKQHITLSSDLGLRIQKVHLSSVIELRSDDSSQAKGNMSLLLLTFSTVGHEDLNCPHGHILGIFFVSILIIHDQLKCEHAL